jgi:hypothetical protein
MTHPLGNEVLAWCPDQATFHKVMKRIKLPDGTPLAKIIDVPTGKYRKNGKPITRKQLVFIDGLIVDEIGSVTVEHPVFDPQLNPDGSANLISDGVIAEGHHVNMMMHGPLAQLINKARPADMTLAEFLMVSGLVPGMKKMPKDKAKRKPGGREGTSMMRIFDPTEITTRRRKFAA